MPNIKPQTQIIGVSITNITIAELTALNNTIDYLSGFAHSLRGQSLEEFNLVIALNRQIGEFLVNNVYKT